MRVAYSNYTAPWPALYIYFNWELPSLNLAAMAFDSGTMWQVLRLICRHNHRDRFRRSGLGHLVIPNLKALEFSISLLYSFTQLPKSVIPHSLILLEPVKLTSTACEVHDGKV